MRSEGASDRDGSNDQVDVLRANWDVRALSSECVMNRGGCDETVVAWLALGFSDRGRRPIGRVKCHHLGFVLYRRSLPTLLAICGLVPFGSGVAETVAVGFGPK